MTLYEYIEDLVAEDSQEGYSERIAAERDSWNRTETCEGWD